MPCLRFSKHRFHSLFSVAFIVFPARFYFTIKKKIDFDLKHEKNDDSFCQITNASSIHEDSTIWPIVNCVYFKNRFPQLTFLLNIMTTWHWFRRTPIYPMTDNLTSLDPFCLNARTDSKKLFQHCYKFFFLFLFAILYR